MFETLYFQVEDTAQATILDDDNGTIARTQSENQEKAGINNPDQPGTGDDNPGLPEFDPYGIRPDYSGTGYVDLVGGAEDKLSIDFDAPAGTYDVTVRVAADSDRSISVAVDGGTPSPAQDGNSGEFYIWTELTFTVEVTTAGAHTLVIAQTTSNGPNIDAVAISEVGADVNFAAPEFTSAVSFDVAENTSDVGTVTTNDIDGDAITYAIEGGDDAGAFTIDGTTGALAFGSAPDFEAPGDAGGDNVYNVTVAAFDGTDTTTQDIAVTVTNVDEAPVLADGVTLDDVTTDEGTGQTVDLAPLGATDPEGQAITYGVRLQDGNPAPAGITVAGTELTIAATVPADTYALDVFASDGVNESPVVALNVTVAEGNTNTNPVANDDNATTAINVPVTIDVLANDTDLDADTLSIVSFTQAASGVVSENPDGTLTYTPNAGFNGADTFTYTVTDGNGGTATASVDVTVNAPSDAVFRQPGVTVFDGSRANVINLAHTPELEIPEGTIALSFKTDAVTGRQGILTKDAADFQGGGNHFALYLDGSTLIARFEDGETSENMRFSGIEAGEEYEVAATFGAGGVELFVNGQSIQSNSGVTMSWATNQEYLQIGGLGWGGPTGSDGFGYPFSGAIADVEIYGQVLDGDAIAALAQTSSLDTGENTDPVANDDTATTVIDAPVTIDVLANDTDLDADALSIDSFTQGTSGVVSENPDGTLTYTPNAGFNGADTFTYTVTDGNGGTATASVDVTVNAPSDAVFRQPGVTVFDGSRANVINLAHTPELEIPEGTIALSFKTDAVTGRQGILTKDAADFQGGGNHFALYLDGSTLIARFEDGETSENMRFSGIEAGEEYEVAATFGAGGVELFVNGQSIQSNSGVTMSWATNQEYLQIGGLGWGGPTGSDGFGYPFSGAIADVEIYGQVLDGDAIAALAQTSSLDTGENTDPVANDDTATTVIDAPVTIDVLANDTDLDADALSIDSFTQGTSGVVSENPDGTLTYTPNAGFNGADTFTYTVTDGNGGTATASVDVTVNAPSDAVFRQPGVTVFDGSRANVINLAHTPELEIPEGTIALSFKTDAVTGRQGILTKDAADFQGGGNHFALYLDGSTLIARFEDGETSENMRFSGIEAGEEYEVAATFGAGGVELFVNGQSIQSNSGVTMSWETNQEYLQIGGLGWGGPTGSDGFGYPFSGEIADVEIYGQVLDGDAIAALAQTSSIGGGGNTAPEITSGDAFDVAENTTVVATVTADDLDGDTITYAIDGGADAGAFTIDGATGALAFVSAPDFEVPGDDGGDNVYNVTVSAFDGTDTTTQDIAVTVTDIDEIGNTAPEITSGNAFDVAENTTVVATVTADDLDGDTITYAIDGGADAGAFTIDGATGALAFVSAPDFEVPGDDGGDNVYNVTVSAFDGTDTTTQDIAVTVTDIDEIGNTAPEITSGNAFDVPENTTDVATVTADDLDGDTITYAIDGGADAGAFTIDGATGALAFVSAPDFEAPGDAGGDNVYNVTVAAFDGTDTTTQDIAVTVTDIDEIGNTAPEITSGDAFDVAENTTVVATVTADDLDGDTITYAIDGGADAGAFTIDGATGALAFVSAPDFEVPGDDGGDNVYNVTVSAFDGTDTTTQDIAVTVTDIDEIGNTAPEITSGDAFDVAENTTDVATVTADDLDGDTITYAIDGGADAGAFTIDGATGALAFSSAPDFEVPGDDGGDNVYNVTVSATDGIETTTQEIAVTVTNVDEAPVLADGVTLDDVTTDEGTGQTVDLAPLGATDPEGQAITYGVRLQDGNPAPAGITVAGTQLTIADTVPADTYALEVFASDGVNESSTVALNVTVNDAKSRPFETIYIQGEEIVDVIDVVSLARTQTENQERDGVNGGPVQNNPGLPDFDIYGLRPGYTGDGYLDINGLSGDKATITFDGPAGSYDITFRLANGADSRPLALRVEGNTTAAQTTDTGGWGNWQERTFTVEVTGSGPHVVTIVQTTGGAPNIDAVAISQAGQSVDFGAPTFTSSAVAAVDENLSDVQVVASEGFEGVVAYSVVGGADAAAFTIDGSTGALSLVAPGDFENPADADTSNDYEVVVAATDGTLTALQTVIVTVGDVDEAPVLADGVTLGDVTTDEGTGQTVDLAPLGATDPEGQAVTYGVRLQDGNPAPAGITVAGTELTIAATVSADTYALEVFASDGVNESPAVALNVTVAEADLVPSDFSVSYQTEDAAVITDTGAADMLHRVFDDPSTGEGGNNKDRFGNWDGYEGRGYTDFGEDAGDLFTIDVEVPVAGTYALHTRYANGSGSAPNRLIDISVGGETQTVNFNREGTATWTDWNVKRIDVVLEAGVNTLTYAINPTQSPVTGPNIDAIALTAVTGTPNFDAGNTAPAFFSSADISVQENTTDVGTVVADDVDIDDGGAGDTLTYAIAGGDDAGAFTIDSATGALSFTAAPDFEAPGDAGGDNVYNVTVSVTDGTDTTTQDIAVTVTDVDETVPQPEIAQILVQAEAGVITDAAGNPIPQGGANTQVRDADNPENSGNRPDFTGTGYLDFGSTPGDKSTVTLNVAEAGEYQLNVRYASNTDRPLTLAVNGVDDPVAMAFLSTDPDGPGSGTEEGFDHWEVETRTVVLAAGDNTISLAIPAGANTGPNVDAIALTTVGASANFAAPEITSADAFDVPENSTDVATVTADDLDGDTVTYAIDGGADQAAFTIDGTTGALAFVSAPDFEVPGDAGGDNVYNVTVSATDGIETSTQDIAVTVTDVDETGSFQPIELQPSDDIITLSDSPDGDATVTFHRDNDDPADAENSNDGTILDEFGLRAGYSGNGYLDFGDDPGDTALFTFTVPTAGDYDLNIRYASQDVGGNARVLDLSINDGAPTTTTFPSTGPGSGPAELQGFNVWEFLTQTVSLQAGENTVALTMAPGTNAGPNVDRVEITEAGTGPIDRSADEDGNYAVTATETTVDESDLGAVEYRLSGVDADIETFEVSLDGGATFADVAPTPDGADFLVSLDLTSFAGQPSAAVEFRVTDEAGNQASVTETVTIQDDGTQPFFLEVQLESRTGDVTIIDDTPGTNDLELTQPRDPLNPEGVTAARPNGLWENFTGDGYLDMGLNVGDAASFDVDAPEAGTYTFTWRYANGSTAARPMEISVDGTSAGVVDFGPTPDWDEWLETSIDVSLAAGVNTVQIANTIATGPNLDRVTITNNVIPVVEPGPRETIRINFQDGTTPDAAGYLVDNFEGFGDRGNGFNYGWVTEASATDADGTTATPIDGNAYPAVAINERTGAPFDDYDPRLTGYAHFDLRTSYPAGDANRTAWQLELENGWYEVTVSVGDTGGPNDSNNRLFIEGELSTSWVPTDEFKSQLITKTVQVQDGFLTLSAQGGDVTEIQYLEVRELPDLTPDDAREAPEDYANFFDARAISGVGANEVVVDLDPGDGVRPDDVDPTSDIFLGINVVDGRGGALLEKS